MQEDINRLQRQIDELKQQLSWQNQGQLYGIDFANLINFIEVVTVDPSVDSTGALAKPDTIYGQIKIFYNSVGPAWKLYLYDRINSVWKSATLT